MHMGRPVFSEGLERACSRMPPDLAKELWDYVEALGDSDDYGQPCIWLDMETRRCRYYEYRPKVCREFEVGGRGCQLSRKEQGFDC